MDFVVVKSMRSSNVSTEIRIKKIQPHILLVDVGGTKTELTSEHIHERFPSNPEQLSVQLRKVIKRLPKVDQLIVGIRGVWTPIERRSWKKKLANLCRRLTILSDIELSHYRAFGPTNSGIVLSAGTGSIAFGRNSRGKTARAGGLGIMIGDEGSGFWIGKTWLKRKFEDSGDWETVRAYVKRPDAVRAIAALASPLLTRAAGKRVSLERSIAKEAVVHLSKLIWQVRKELAVNNQTPLHLVGGLFEHAWFKKEFLKLCY